MIEATEALRARLHEDVLTLCFCWRLTRQDGLVLGLTNHDRPLNIGGVSYTPGAAWETDRFVRGADLQAGTVSASGILSSDAIRAEDLRNGLWDGCEIAVYRVDWQAPELGGLHVWSGSLSAITVSEQGAFQAELVSQMAALQRPLGRVLQRQCDAVLGDDRCGLSANGRTCDRRYETCRDVFANTENFRGFPHLPGNDFILAGPAANGNDGGKR